jgi:MoaA/NifB/PqqE/SkfB family radical SAM enzyme
MSWHPPLVEFFRKHLASDSFVRPHAKRVVEDCRTLLRSGVDWRKFEHQTPQTLHLETTNICNANCVFCAYQYQSGFREGRGVMSDRIFYQALCDYARMGGVTGRKEINFTPLAGEPLIDPHLIERAQLAAEFGFRTTFFTNGILLRHIDIDALLDAGVYRLVISTAPFDRESHERLYRTNGKYEDLRAGVQKLLKRRNQRHSPMVVSLQFRADVGLAEILRMPDFQRLILPHLRPEEVKNLYAQVRSFDNWGGQIKPGDLPAGMQIADAPLLKYRPCHWLFSPQVLYDGRVRACSGRFTARDLVKEDGLLVGDLRSQTLGEIWDGDALRDLRRDFERGTLPPVCQSCTMYRSA